MPRTLSLLPFAALLPSLVFALGFYGCGSDASSSGGGGADATASGDDAASRDDAWPPTDAGAGDATPEAADAGACPSGKVVSDAGETCTGFGQGTPCTPGCGLYGYVCFGGGPPGFTGCYEVKATAFGDTYCCPENKCVADPDQDSKCAAVPGKAHLYQCPPDGTPDGGSVAPPAACAETTSLGGSYRYYCCP